MQDNSFGKYQIIGHVGRGAMANVYKALHPELNRVVAIKVLNRALVHSSEMRERFRREARAVAALRHPNIVQVFDFDVVDDVYFMVMEFIEGEALNQRLADLRRRGERVPVPDLLYIVSAVGRALHYAHEQGMLHRDIKPGNIMFRGDGSVVLTDFGVAKILNVSSDITATGVVTGTPAYMAPEQWTEGEPDLRSDIYSLGVVLYELTTGELPFNDEMPGRLMFKHISESPRLPRTLVPDIPVELEGVILRALAKDPPDRYQTAQELVDDLEGIIYNLESTAPTGIFRRSPLPQAKVLNSSNDVAAPSNRRLSWFWLGVAAFIALTMFVVWIVRDSAGSAAPLVTPNATVTALAARLVALESTLAVTPTPSPTSLPSPTPIPATAVPTASPTSLPSPTMSIPTPTLKPTNSPTATPSPSPTTAICNPTVALVQDVSYSNEKWWSSVGASFEKTWRLRNEGDCAWPKDTVLAHLDGEDFGLDEPVPVRSSAPDEEFDLSILLTAPDIPDQYQGRFQLQTPDGQSFGDPLVVTVDARPSALLTQQASEVTEPVTFDRFDLFDWSVDHSRNSWHGKVRLWASGGTGQYVWYRDTIDEPLPGDVLEFEWGVCRAFYGSVWVISGGTQDHQDLYIPYPGTCE